MWNWILIEFYISFSMIKYFKFIDNIGPGNFTDTFCQNTNKFQKSGGKEGGRGGGGGVIPCLRHNNNSCMSKELRKVIIFIQNSTSFLINVGPI